LRSPCRTSHVSGHPWAAAVALGAIVAPPDAVAALAVLREVDPPHRVRVVLEGESLLNDAAALLVYRLAVGAVAAGSFSFADAAPAFALTFVGSIAAGWLAAHAVGMLMKRVPDAPSSVILQFVTTFGVWLAAERLGLSGVVTIVVYGLTLARGNVSSLPARLRVHRSRSGKRSRSSSTSWPSRSWAFSLGRSGMRLAKPNASTTCSPHSPFSRPSFWFGWFGCSSTISRTRLFGGSEVRRTKSDEAAPSVGDALAVGWSGMRGIVTLATALALPGGFPYRDFIQLTAFVVVLGTLVLQGLTLRPLLRFLALPKDDLVENELSLARKVVLKAAMAVLDGDTSPSAERLREEYAEALGQARGGTDPYDAPDNALRREVVTAGRSVIEDLRSAGTIGDTAYRRIEEELDWHELSLGRGAN
jgi:NhaP-type Na+/H+ or K+/H+ antiporter